MVAPLSKMELEALRPYCETPRQHETVDALIAGGTGPKAAELMGIKERNVWATISRIRGKIPSGPMKDDPVPVTPQERFVTSRAVYKIKTSKTQPEEAKHFFIPDTQVKPGISTDYLEWCGHYIVNRKPDVIIHAGDHFDMESLSSYDKGKKKAEGRRVAADIDAGIEGMNRLLKPIFDYQQKYDDWMPRMVFTTGNHEQRIMRHVEANPELDGFLGYENLRLEDMGWEVYDFLKPVEVNGVSYCHYMANPMSGKPYGGQAMNILKNVGESFTVGHKQTLDVATRHLPSSGRQQWGIVAGAFYEHDEDYKGHQGNYHWRGVIVKHGVKDGSYNPMFVDLDYLRRRYG